MEMKHQEPTTVRSIDEERSASSAPALALEMVHAVEPGEHGRFVTLSPQGLVLVGRGVETGLRVSDERLSRLHFRIVWDAVVGSYRCADAGSANGTFLNGSRMDSALLSPGDVIRAGRTLLVVRPLEAESPADAEVQRLAKSGLPVLVSGETGTGKERLARRLHEASGRTGALVSINCGTLSRELAAAELFGHTRHAFSGADVARVGLFRSAEGGTLFLDEIGDLPQEVQPALLRVLQEHSLRPVGSDREVPVDARIVAATHRDLEKDVREGRFREDLLARIAHGVLTVPPLRQRRWQILRLARDFAPELTLTTSAAEGLLLWTFPRNVRELKAVMESLRANPPPDRVVCARDLAPRIPTPDDRGRNAERAHASSKSALEPGTSKREALILLLRKHRGSIAVVARDLGKPRSQVYRWMRQYGLSKDSFRAREPNEG
jgi:transcriptional regulator with AAA-type ATPase domain